jgi:two-component system, OmpR family, response regulator RegX3
MDMRQSILMVEDEEAIARPLVSALGRELFEVDVVSTAADALDALTRSDPDLVLLDLSLPDGDGKDVCKEIRKSSDVPIIMVTARGEELDRVVGLELGADDYVAKPFSSRELVARIRAVLRRSGSSPDRSHLRIGDIFMDPAARRVEKGGHVVELTAKEFDLLHLLMARAGDVVTREEIMEEVWDEHWFGSTKTLDVHIAWLRKKIEADPGTPVYITTLRGVGFRFASDEDARAAV